MKRFDDQWVDVQGIRTRYWTAGAKGSPVVLLHGIGCSALEWNQSIDAMAARGHRVFALDMLGSGGTDKPAHERYSLRRLADLVLAFAHQLGLGPVHLAGNSLGGRVALECALVAPAQVRSLLLVDPAGVGFESFLPFRLATLPLLGELLTWPNKAGLRTLWRMAYFNPRLLEEERIEEKLADARQPGTQAAFLKILRGFLGLSGFPRDQVLALQAALPNVKQPTLIVWGAQDHLLPVAQGRALQKLMPHARLEIIDQCGHLPQLEAPEAFNQAALAFWAGLTEGMEQAPTASATGSSRPSA